MFAQVYSGGIQAVDGYIVSVEADVSDGLPFFNISGQLSTEVRESQNRVRTALKNAGFRLPAKKITVNLSPAGIRKGGTAFDLAIAAAVLGAFGLLNMEGLKDSIVLGELGLDGSVKPVNGILSLVMAAREYGLSRCFLPEEGCGEGSVIEGMEIVGVSSVGQLAGLLERPADIPFFEAAPAAGDQESYPVDYQELNGQEVLKRAAEVAAAGMHGLLISGRAGTGKTMAAKRLPTILPELTREEDIAISKVYSVCGLLPPGRPLLSRRPFRSPHHTITPHGLIGGGSVPRPGELSLASGGVLFLDELPLFGRASLEALRQPLEEGRVTITRASGTYELPADFMIAAAMNPCPCGFYPDRSRCSCSEADIRTYLSRLSRPLMDRFDICVEAAPITFDELKQESARNESSASIRRRVERARRRQEERFLGTKIRFNSRMGQREIGRFCRLGREEEAFARKVYEIRQISARGYHKVLKTARTIADLDGSEEIRREHLAEAFGYRTLEERLWGKG